MLARWSVWRDYQVVGSRVRWHLLLLDMRSKKKQEGQIDSVLREKTSVTAEAMFRGSCDPHENDRRYYATIRIISIDLLPYFRATA